MSSQHRHIRPSERGANPSPDHPDLAAALGGRIALVALIVVTQLWAMTVALDTWFERNMVAVWWLLGYQAIAFASSLLIWSARPEERRIADR